MLDQKDILIFIHTLALAIALGGSIFEVFILPTILREKSDQKNNLKITARAINLFSPINFGMLVVIVFTGVLLLFSFYEKISNISSPLYLNVFFIKIVLVAVIFSIAAYQTFHLRFRIVIMNIDKIKNKNTPQPFRIMRTCSIINIILITVVILLGIIMSNLT